VLRREDGVCVAMSDAKARSWRSNCCTRIGSGNVNHQADASLLGVVGKPARVSVLYDAALWSVCASQVVNSLLVSPRTSVHHT
jgi:hypothetical protein